MDASDNDQINILLLGVTGYVGGGVLSRLLSDGKAALFDITVVLRDRTKASKLEPFGLTAVIGTLDDTELLQSLAAKADIVLECADADHVNSTKAILAGLRERHDSTGKVPTLIHTSGTGCLADSAAGKFSTDVIYYDNDPDQLDTISPEQAHRDVDLVVLNADKEGYVNTYLVLPSTIYGLAKGPLVDAHIMNPQSQQVPALIMASIDRREAGMVGEGRNIWPNVHIDDIVHLYEVIWNCVLEGKEIGHGREGYYFGENGEHTLVEVARAIGAVLKDFELARTDAPSSFTEEELDKYFAGSTSLGSNSRCRAARSKEIGWKPEKKTLDLLKSIRTEIQYMLSHAAYT